ncbi:MAG: succinate dehydrogenase, cytochrome b556 subunit [Burkholderiaceae bacterium]|jgi:succinate dehydrogenase / fumarate reductase cytochrome b subunit
MADAIKAIKKRPGEMRLIDATQYRLPPAGWVSILHRVSGLLLIVLMPFVIWMFDTSLTSEVTFTQFRGAFIGGIGFVPAFVVKLAALVLIWSFLQHFCAGVRHLYMDFTHSVTKEFGRTSALVAMGVAGFLTLVFAYKLFIGY